MILRLRQTLARRLFSATRGPRSSPVCSIQRASCRATMWTSPRRCAKPYGEASACSHWRPPSHQRAHQSPRMARQMPLARRMTGHARCARGSTTAPGPTCPPRRHTATSPWRETILLKGVPRAILAATSEPQQKLPPLAWMPGRTAANTLREGCDDSPLELGPSGKNLPRRHRQPQSLQRRSQGESSPVRFANNRSTMVHRASCDISPLCTQGSRSTRRS